MTINSLNYFSSKHCKNLLAILLGLLLVGLLSCRQFSRSAPVSEEKRSPEIPLSKVAPPTIVAHPAFAYTSTSDGKQVNLSDIAERSVKSVVNIFSTRIIQRPPELSPFHGHPFFERQMPFDVPREQRARSLGSGVIVTNDGVVLTNNHVVEHADSIRARTFDGRELEAKLLGADPKSDLAVVRLKGNLAGLQPLQFCDSSKVRLGEVVLAIGNPFGIGQTVTMGIVSAVGRANMGIVDYEDFIQTDAAINPGNSGGALVNMRAELVGINTAILSKSGGYQGIGFSIPSGMAQPIMESLLKTGKVVRGWLGVMIQDLNEDIARVLKIPQTRGVLVTDVVPDSPAAKAGLRREDVITHLDGVPLDSSTHLRNRIAAIGISRSVKISLLRDNKKIDLQVLPTESPTERVAKLDRSQGALGGLTLEPLSDETRNKLNLPARVSGVVVKSIDRGSASQNAGLREGDLILEINRQPVSNPLQFATIYRQAVGKVLLLVFREGTTLYLLLEK